MFNALEIDAKDRHTVLVADDDPICRRLFEKRLTAWGYRVIAVEDGAKAWDVLQQKDSAPSLVIIDWLMPGINGIELCRRIRESQQSSYQYLLLVSGKDEKQDVVEGLYAGAAAAKPPPAYSCLTWTTSRRSTTRTATSSETSC